MNKRNTAHFRMFQNVQDHLDNNTTIWSTILRVVEYKNDFDEIISLVVLKSDNIAGMVGIGKRKKALRNIIAIKAAAFSGALQVYALEQENEDLAKKVKATRNQILRMKDENIGGFIKLLTGTATKNLPEVANYGINQANITELNTTMDDYSVLIGKPRSIKNTKFVAIDAVDDLIDEGNKLLREKMDKIMLMFQENHPDFYNGYQRARVIVDL